MELQKAKAIAEHLKELLESSCERVTMKQSLMTCVLTTIC